MLNYNNVYKWINTQLNIIVDKRELYLDFDVFYLCRMMRGSCSCWQGQQKRASWRGSWPGSSSGSGRTEGFRLASVAPGSTSSTTPQHSEFALGSWGLQASVRTDDLSPPKATWMTWRGYPTGRMSPPSRMCWGPESKLLELWKHTLLSRIFTSSKCSHARLFGCIEPFRRTELWCHFSECLM